MSKVTKKNVVPAKYANKLIFQENVEFFVWKILRVSIKIGTARKELQNGDIRIEEIDVSNSRR